MDEKSLEDAMERLLTSPKEVEVDGQRVTNQSVGDLIKVANYLASKNALKGSCRRSSAYSLAGFD